MTTVSCVMQRPLKAQLATLQATGSGYEPKSLLDALYKVETMDAGVKGSQTDDPGKWFFGSSSWRVDW